MFPTPSSCGGKPLLSCCLVLALSLLAGCAVKMPQAPPEAPRAPYAPGQLVLPGGAPAVDKDFLHLAASADYILLGESHDSALDHKIQAALLKILAKEGRNPVLGLEMLPRYRYDGVLAAFSEGGGDIRAMPFALDWKQTWGFDFNLYKPVFEVAGEYRIPVYGLNIPNGVRKSVSARGLNGLTAAEKRELPRRIVPPLPEQREKLALFFSKHYAMLAARKAGGSGPAASPGPGGSSVSPASSSAAFRPMPASFTKNSRAEKSKPVAVPPAPAGEGDVAAVMRAAAFERFLLIQSLWDSTMAEAAVAVRQREGGSRPLLILAGSGHVEYGYGIASRLKLFDPDARSLLVLPFSGSRPEAPAADLFFFSPRPMMPPMARQEAALSARPRAREGLGLTLEPAGNKLRVAGVAPGSRAEKAGIAPGDIIERAGGLFVTSPADLHKAALEARRLGQPLSVALCRQGEMFAVYLGKPD